MAPGMLAWQGMVTLSFGFCWGCQTGECGASARARLGAVHTAGPTCPSLPVTREGQLVSEEKRVASPIPGGDSQGRK